MKNLFRASAAAALCLVAACGSQPEPPPTETTIAADAASPAVAADGGAMAATGTIADNVAASAELGLLASALAGAGLSEMMREKGPYTLFAPTDAAFAQVPPVTRDGWMRPAQKDVLAGVLKNHIVAGKLTAADIAARIAEGDGRATFRTLDGQDLVATAGGESIILTGAGGNKAVVTRRDLDQSNGVIHMIDAVLLPKM